MEELKQQKDHPDISITDALIDLVRQLPQSQQEYLLSTLSEWMKDNREYPRVDCDLEILYSDYNQLEKGVAKNISAKGVYLSPAGPFPVGQEIIITMAHPSGDEQVKLGAKVVRLDEKGMAIEFEKRVQGIL